MTNTEMRETVRQMMSDWNKATISTRVLSLTANGMDPIAALKAVCGNETVDRMIDALYRELRAKS